MIDFEAYQRQRNLDKRQMSGKERATVTLAHKFALGVLSAFDPPFLMQCIRRNAQFTWRDYQNWGRGMPAILHNTFRKLWINNRQKILRFLNPIELKFQLYEHRKDLLQVFQITDGMGDRWLQSFINGLLSYWQYVYGR
jgi:hypothetical protein